MGRRGAFFWEEGGVLFFLFFGGTFFLFFWGCFFFCFCWWSFFLGGVFFVFFGRRTFFFEGRVLFFCFFGRSFFRGCIFCFAFFFWEGRGAFFLGWEGGKGEVLFLFFGCTLLFFRCIFCFFWVLFFLGCIFSFMCVLFCFMCVFFCEWEGVVVGDEAPLGGVAQDGSHGVKVVGVHGEEGKEEDGELQVKVKGEVEENQRQPHMDDMWMKVKDSWTP